MQRSPGASALPVVHIPPHPCHSTPPPRLTFHPPSLLKNMMEAAAGAQAGGDTRALWVGGRRGGSPGLWGAPRHPSTWRRVSHAHTAGPGPLDQASSPAYLA